MIRAIFAVLAVMALTGCVNVTYNCSAADSCPDGAHHSQKPAQTLAEPKS